MVSAPNRDLLFESSQSCRNEGYTGHETRREILASRPADGRVSHIDLSVLKMLSRNLVIASVAVVFLVSTVSTAPVEDKEPEENDFEAEEGEEELSEEDDGVGSQQATSAPKGSGMSPSPGSSVPGESPNGHKLNGATQTGQVSLSGPSTSSSGASGSNGRDGYSRPSSHGSSNNGQNGSKSELIPSAGGTGAHGGLGSKVPGPDGGVHTVSISIVSSGQGSSGHAIGRPSTGQMSGASGVVSSEVQSQTSGSEAVDQHAEGSENGDSAHEGSQIESPEIPETETNGNGHKHLMNGGETGFTGLDHFMPGSSPIQGTDTVDQSSHDFLVGLMGEMGENFGPDTQTGGLDHTGLEFQVDSTADGLSPGQLSSSASVLDVPPAGPPHPSADNGNHGFSPSISVSDNGEQSRLAADTTDSVFILDTLAHPDHFLPDYSDGGLDNNGADGPETNGNGRHKPVVDKPKGVTEHQFVAMETDHTAAGTLDVNDHTLSPYADTTGHDSLTGASVQTDTAGAPGESVTDGNVQTDMSRLAVTDGLLKYTACVSEKQILCMRRGLDIQMPHRHIVMWYRHIYQPQEIHWQFLHRQMSWAQPQLNLKGLPGVQQAVLVLQNRHRQLYQQVNSTTHQVRVLKVQKMWNWKIPADFHMKPRVKFLRYRFQCIDQNAWQRNRKPAR
nr:uncharacterized protein si:ch211-80h18.1 isoform X7 [Misgurnus anguillicaudatus]